MGTAPSSTGPGQPPSGQFLRSNVLESFQKRKEVPHAGVLLADLGKGEEAQGPALFLIPEGSGAGRETEQVERSPGGFLGRFSGVSPRVLGSFPRAAGIGVSLGGRGPHQGVFRIC